MKQERGGTLLGFIIGVVVGLGGALAVAVYVTKVPVPFTNKSQSRSAEQDDAETKKNKDWDPNAPLYGKNPVKAATPTLPSPAGDLPAPASDSKPVVKADRAKVEAKPEVKPAVSADPLGDLVKAKAGVSASEPFSYFVQVGAFRTADDAQAQRAKLSLSGIETKVSEREQSGRMVYRVRVGPFAKKEDAERSKENLDKSGLETALVRVQP
jgi:cell division protein FtsN